MPLRLYMDHHVSRAITAGLRLRHIDVLTAAADGTITLDDPVLLDRATALGRVLFFQDADLLVEATRRQTIGEEFGEIIYADQLTVPMGMCVQELELIAIVNELEKFLNHATFLQN